MPNPTVAKSGESGFIFQKNKVTNQIEVIATTANMQVGLPNQPADLTVTGTISLSSVNKTLAAGSAYDIDSNVTNVNITTTGLSGTVTVRLPRAPRKGQLVYIKDAGGSAGTVSITIVGSPAGTQTSKGIVPHLIDGQTSTTITTNYGILQFLWDGTTWLSVSSSGAAAGSSYVVLSADGNLSNERVLTAGAGISITDGGAGSTVTISAAGVGSGDVIGPASSTDNAVARFDLTTGKLIQNSGVTIDDSNNVIVPGRITVTGGTTSYTDAILGNAAVGSFPFWDGGAFSGLYAMFGHKDLDNSSTVTNYALFQDNTGNTAVNASTTKSLYLAVNNTAMGLFTDSLLGTGISSILLTGDSATRTNVRLGNSTGASITQIYAGTGGISLSGSATTTITGSTSNQTELIVGNVEIGEFPYTRATFPNYFAMFGHKTLDHSVNGNYALVQSYSGDSFLNSPTTIYLQNAGNLIGYLDNNNISLTGQSNTTVVSELGSNYDLSSTSIKGGQFGISLSASFTIITSSYPAQNLGADAKIGAVEIGSLPGFANQYAMFGHQELDHTLGNYAVVQKNDGITYINSPLDKQIYFTSAGNPAELGSIYYSSLFGAVIDFTGRSGQRATVNLGSSTSTSLTNIYGGSGGILLSASSGYTTITGSSATRSDVIIGDAEIGSLPGFAGQYAMFGHKDLNHAFGNYSLAQSNVGDTWVNASQNKSVYFTSEGSVSYNGYISYSNLFSRSFISLQGRSGSPTTVTLGSLNGNSATSIYGGSGNVNVSGSAVNIDSSPGGYTYFKSNSNQLGYIGFSSFFNKTLINLQGNTSLETNTTIGNFVGTSTTTIYAGSGGNLLSSSAGYTTIIGSTPTTTEAIIGVAAVGELPATRAGFPNYFSMFGHKNLDQSTLWNYAMVQNGAPHGVAGRGDTFINSPGTIYFQFSGSSGGTVGTLDSNTVSFTGLAGTATTTTIGNTTGTSSITIDAGTGNIDVGTSASARTINIGTGAAAQTLNLGTGNTGTQTVNIGTFASNTAIIRIGNYGTTPESTTNIYGDSVSIATSVDRIGFFGATAVVQYGTTGTTTGFTAGAGTAARVDSTYTGNNGTKAYTVGDIVAALKAYGLLDLS